MKTVALGEVAEIVSGATPKTSVADYWDGDVWWVTPADLSKLDEAYISATPRTITAAGLASCAATVLPPGSVLLSSRAPIGHVAINTVPMATNQGFKSLVPCVELLDAKFLYHWLRSRTAYLQGLGNGATFKEVSKATVSRVEIPLPPLAEQRRIAAILDHADALRAKRRQVITHLDQLAQSIFVDMFGDNVPLRPISELCELLVDCVNRTAPIVEEPTPYKMIRTSNVRNGRVDTSNVKYVTAEVFARWNRRATPRPGDVILTREAPVGEAGVLNSADSVFLGQRLFLYRTDPKELTPEFLLACFRSPILKAQFDRLGSGSTVKHLPLPACQSFMVPTPSLEAQREYSARVRRIADTSAVAATVGTHIDELFDALQSRAFSGAL